ncbi:GNAT family N-acetyltransferase [Pseudomonas helleri]|jgi:hypothetical protein|uniref:GNAT family N-acetyltransferase n=1 Tax=Pseudomonas helleri TaxID=1608996 RepID=UPI003FD56457
MIHNVQIVRHSWPINDGVCQEVIDLVTDNATSLSMMQPAKTSPTFKIYQTALEVEVANYLCLEPPNRMELVTADYSGGMIGFALCGLPLNGSSLECEIYYLAVAKPFRGHKVMSLMVRDILARYPGVSLCCGLKLVPQYQGFGFKCVDQIEQNVVMVRGTRKEDIPVIPPMTFMTHPLVVQEREQAQKKFTQRELDRADRDMSKQLHQAKENTKRFLKIQNPTKKTSKVAPVPPIV